MSGAAWAAGAWASGAWLAGSWGDDAGVPVAPAAQVHGGGGTAQVSMRDYLRRHALHDAGGQGGAPEEAPEEAPEVTPAHARRRRSRRTRDAELLALLTAAHARRHGGGG